MDQKKVLVRKFYQQFVCIVGDLVFSESLCKKSYKKLFQQICELRRISWGNINQKPNLDIPRNNIFLLSQDILVAANHLIRMKFGRDIYESFEK